MADISAAVCILPWADRDGQYEKDGGDNKDPAGIVRAGSLYVRF